MESVVIDLAAEGGEAIRIEMTKSEFLNWDPDDGFLYEFDAGFAEPTTGMKKEERYIVRNLQRAFKKTTAYTADALLLEESEVWLTPDQKRIPDVSLFTDQQIQDSLTEANDPIPAFVVEIISPTDVAGKVERKVLEYFEAGVQVVWHIYPDLRMVRVMTSSKVAHSFFGEDTFDAAPVLPDLHLTVQDLFSL